MHGLITPVLIPGLLCTAELFRDQLQALCDLAVRDPAINAPEVADTLSHEVLRRWLLAALTDNERAGGCHRPLDGWLCSSGDGPSCA